MIVINDIIKYDENVIYEYDFSNNTSKNYESITTGNSEPFYTVASEKVKSLLEIYEKQIIDLNIENERLKKENEELRIEADKLWKI